MKDYSYILGRNIVYKLICWQHTEPTQSVKCQNKYRSDYTLVDFYNISKIYKFDLVIFH